MTTAREYWRPIINDFNPVGPARPEDVERFFVDRKKDKPNRSLIEGLKLCFQNSIEPPNRDNPPRLSRLQRLRIKLSKIIGRPNPYEINIGQPNFYKALLTGHVGSGKSSELMRLGQELTDDFFVVWFDAETTLVTETTNHFDVLLSMGLAVHKAALAKKLRPSRRLANDFVMSFATFVRTHEKRKGFSLRLDQLIKQVFAIALGATGVPPGVVTAGSTAIGATRLELKIDDRSVKSLELPANRQEIIGALNKIIAGVRRRSGKPLLIITDGLDKVPAARARLLFADSSLLTEPACALIYAAPIEFYHRVIAGQATNLFNELKMLPNPPVRKRPLIGANWKLDRETDEKGFEIMRDIVAKRLAERGKSVGEIITPNAHHSRPI